MYRVNPENNMKRNVRPTKKNNSIPEEIIWNPGMDLSPQHLQQGFQRQQSLMHFQVQELIPFSWGIRELQIDDTKLQDGIFEIELVEAKFPDGLEVNYIVSEGENKLSINFEDYKDEFKTGPAVIAIQIPVENENAYLGYGKSERFDTVEGQMVIDETIEDDPISFARWRPKLTVGFYQTDTVKLLQLPIAKIALKDKVYTEEPYIPPTMTLLANPVIREICADVPRRLQEKATFLSEKAKAMATLQDKMALFEIKMQTNALISRLPELEAVLSFDELHPYQLYIALRAIAGSVANLTPDMLPKSFEPYDHLEIHQSYSEIVEYVLETIESGIQEAYWVLPFAKDEDEHIFSIDFDAGWPSDQLFLGIKGEAGMTDEQVKTWAENCLIGSESVINDLRMRRLRGLERFPTKGNDSLIPMGGVTLFELTSSSEFFKPGEALIVTNPADKLPGSPQIIEMSLYVEIPQKEDE